MTQRGQTNERYIRTDESARGLCEAGLSSREIRQPAAMAGVIADAVAVVLLLLYPVWASAAAATVEGRRLHTLFSVECGDYFDWQAVGLLHSLRKAGQPGGVTRLLSCTEDQLSSYRGIDTGHTLQVPSFSRHPRTGDW
jgi:peptidyl serine alpha-galactosyltransferase